MTRIRLSPPVLVSAALLFTAGCGYNTMQSLDERINQAQGQIQTQLQRRADLVPNLVNTVKGITKQEDTVFISIANARARLTGAVQARDIQGMAAANDQLSAGLGRLLAISENYPQLRSSESFNRLMDELSGTENRIAVERMRYNERVQEYNTSRRQFPGVLTARMFNFKDYPLFEAPATAQQVPKVNFQNQK